LTSAQLIAEFEIMLKEHWAYVWGAAKKGVVDCSGAFVYAMGKYGLKIAHGSNSIYRYWLTDKGKLGEINLVPGMAVFKWREEGEPEKFVADGLDDLYHIGLYAGSNRVLEARGTNAGFVESKLTDGWDNAGRLKGIRYEETEVIIEMPIICQATVKTSGGILNLRDAPNGRDIGDIPNGDTVDVLEKTSAEWWKVTYQGKVGWVSVTYLVEVGVNSPETVAVVLPRSTWTAVRDAINTVIH
jgi:hypothetical protein